MQLKQLYHSIQAYASHNRLWEQGIIGPYSDSLVLPPPNDGVIYRVIIYYSSGL